MDWLPFVAVYLNPFIAMFWFVNLISLIKKILDKEEDIANSLIWGCVTLGWLVFSISFFLGSR